MVRDHALESCRQYLNKKLEDKFPGQFFFRVVPFPHHIQRENKMLTGAGADRMQTGMQLSFGRSVGKAALLKEGAPIFEISMADLKSLPFVRETIKQIRAKLPCTIRVLYNYQK